MADESSKELVLDQLGALLDVRDILFVAAVYGRRHLPALTERRYNTFHRPFRLRGATAAGRDTFFRPTGDVVHG